MGKIILFLIVIITLSCTKKNQETNANPEDMLCITITDNVKLYSEKKTNSKITDTIPKNVTVKFIESGNEYDIFRDLDLPEYKESIIYWVTIEYRNVRGYVDSVNIYPLKYRKEYSNIVLLEDNILDEYGTISGLIQYPSEGIPLNMIIAAEEINKKILYLSKNYYAKHQSSDYNYRCYYRLYLPEGEYKILYNFPIGNNKSFESNYKVYYTGFESNYNNGHEPEVIKLKGGETIKNITPSM